MKGAMVLLKKIAAAFLLVSLIFGAYPPAIEVLAAAITNISVTLSATDPGATSNYTIVFTPTTSLAAGSSKVSLIFLTPSEAQVDLSGASRGTGTSAGIGSIQSNSGSTIVFDVQSPGIQGGSPQTLVISGIKNPAKAGKYSLLIWTSSGFSNLDGDPAQNQYLAPYTVGTISVQGTVRAGGIPIAGVSVVARTANFSQNIGANTGDDGSYGIGGLTSGQSYILEVYAPPGNNPLLAGFVPPDSLKLTFTGTTITQDLAFKAATKTLKVTVKRDSGALLAGAAVNAYRRDTPSSAQATTNSAGLATLTLGGGEYDIMVGAGFGGTADYASSGPPTSISFTDDSSTESKAINLEVKTANNTIKGKILTSSGALPAAFSTFVGIFDMGQGFGTGTPVGDGGNFSVKVPDGNYRIMVFAEGSNDGPPKVDTISVKGGESKDVGTLTMRKKTSTISVKVEDTAGNALAGIEIFAFDVTEFNFGSGQSDSAGKIELKVLPGSYIVMAHNEHGGATEYVSDSPAQNLSVTDGALVGSTIKMQKADATLTVNVFDDVNQPVAKLFGWVTAEVAGSTSGGGFGGELGGPLERGSATFKVVGGKTYNLGLHTAPGASHIAEGSTSLAIDAGASKTVNLTAQPVDSFISGTIRDQNGDSVTTSMMVFATTTSGSMIMGNVDPSAGNYKLKVASKIGGGKYRVSYFVDPKTGFFQEPLQSNEVTVTSGNTSTFDISLKKATAALNVTVKDESGAAVSGAVVFADSRSTSEVVEPTKFEAFFNHRNTTNEKGEVTLKLPPGSYRVGAAPPAGRNLIPPKFETVSLSGSSSQSVTIVFRNPDVTYSGTVSESGTAIKSGTVYAYSPAGGYSEDKVDSSGKYDLPLTNDEDWTIGMRADDRLGGKKDVLTVVETRVETSSKTGSVTKDLAASREANGLGQPYTASVDATKIKTVKVDGSAGDLTMTLPANSLATSGSVTLTAQQTEEAGQQIGSQSLEDTTFDLNASSGGQAVTTLNSQATLTIPYDDKKLTNVNEAEIVPAYFDETSKQWVPIGGATVNTSGNSVTFTTNHFTKFALTAAVDRTAPAAPTDLKAGATEDNFVALTWKNPVEKDFDKVYVYRSKQKGERGTKVKTTESTSLASFTDQATDPETTYFYTVTALDKTGNESKDSTQVEVKTLTKEAAAQKKAESQKVLPKTGQPAGQSPIGLISLMSLIGLIGFLIRRREPEA